MKKIKNNRLIRRRRCLVPVDSRAGEAASMRTVDISRRGLGLITERPMAVGDGLAVQMDVSPDGDAVVVWGKVRWVRRIPSTGRYRLGVRFDESTPNASAAELKRYRRMVGA